MDSTSNKGTIAVRTFSQKQLIFEKEIGSGNFGKVYKAIVKDSRVTGVVAVKVFSQKFTDLDSTIRTKAFDELAKVAVLDHLNIVRLLGMVEDGIPWLVFEYMKDGNLLEYVKRKRNIKESTLVGYCRDICNGMSFIHKNNFLHKDLAARNILLDGNSAKIADLGLCSFLTEEHDGSYALGGKLFPYRHAAAECVVECIYTFESDVWSFGVLMFEAFTGGLVPYGKENRQPEVRRFIADDMSPMSFIEPTCSQGIHSIMKSIFKVKREDRPTFPQLLEHFDTILSGQTFKMPRPRRDPSPFQTIRHQRIQDNFISSSERLSNISPPSSTQFLAFPSNLFRSSSIPNITSSQPIPITHRTEGFENGHAKSLSTTPPSAEIPDKTFKRMPKHLDVINGNETRRRAGSYNNISELRVFQNSKVDQNLLKEFVPNRFVHRKL